MQALGCVRIGMCIGGCYSTMYIKDLIICISCRIVARTCADSAQSTLKYLYNVSLKLVSQLNS